MKKYLYIAAAALALVACNNTKPAEADLVVLYTTDVHGACLGYDFKRARPDKTSLANASTYYQKVRSENPGKVILLDTGDFLQGQPSLYYHNFVDTVSPHIVPRIYNYLQYDAIGVGNHDIEPGDALYERRLPSEFNMPWICANAIDTRTGQPMFQPYVVLNREGLRIAVLGMVTPHIPYWLPKTMWPNLRFDDMVDCARKWVPIIRQKENPDLLIALFHSGYDFSKNGRDFDSRCNENGSVPAIVKVPGFDLCLIGHDHETRLTTVRNAKGDTVPLIDAGVNAYHVGRADIHFTRRSDGTYDKTIRTSLVNTIDYPVDTAYVAHFQNAIDSIKRFVESPVGEITTDLVGIDGLIGPSTFEDFIHEAQLWATKADISLHPVLSPNEVIHAGTITMGDLFAIYKYENLLYTIQMTADEVRQYLEHGYNMQFNSMKSPNDHIMNFEPGDNARGLKLSGFTFNYTSAAGIRYEVDVSKMPGSRVRLISMADGSPINPEKLYRVAINSYQYSGGGNFVPLGLHWSREKLQSRTIDVTPIDMRRYLKLYIQAFGPITPHLLGNWKVVPEDWYRVARERDMEILKQPYY
ncbi:MAG: bifunctional metallophosphatase/5'-nucleotidase [Bacteroidales bacterium]|jgi:2',3'-cyclic-nucleotide 2'-phosphodiesterase/3'-nucleotidase|nr:bifunctional metallophosphatase/5'-nucleotidase [Bacteroidales bacterium]